MKQFTCESYNDIKPYFDDLLNRTVKSVEDTEQWIRDYDTLTSHISENAAWKYINKTCYTTNSDYEKAYMTFVQDISPKIQEVSDAINKKIINLPGKEILCQQEAYGIFFRAIEKSLAMFREENIPLHVKDTQIATGFDDLTGVMTISYEGLELTIPQAARYVEVADRDIRKSVYEKIRARRLQDSVALDNIINQLVPLRNTIAINAGYKSYVEYKRDDRGRFDYTQDHVFGFHTGVKAHIVPLLQTLYEEKRQELGLESIKPYDLSAPRPGEVHLQPFSSSDELLEKGIAVMRSVHPSFGDNLEKMKQAGHFDLLSRPGKAPGGYNYPLMVTQYPFIFMNAASTQKDVETFVHEAGHAMHSFCMQDIPLGFFRDYPIEVAEVASMSMELITMQFWDQFYTNPTHLTQAKKEQLFGSLETLAWVAIIDSFQYWMYKNPSHTVEQRDNEFSRLVSEYQPWIDYTDFEHIKKKRWQAQPHIFDIPFYYIEYGICGLAAISMRKQYIENPENAMKNYINMLSLGYTKSIPDIYKAGGLVFDFSPATIQELSDFVMQEWKKLS